MSITIPENHQAFCKELAALARKHGLRELTVQYTPGFDDPWRHRISLRWDAGRHGEDENKIYITSQVDVNAKIDGP